jgi:hypothetical protein
MSNNSHRLVRILLATLFLTILRSTPEAAAPSPPANLSAVVQGMTVTLTWTAASVGDSVASFVLEAGDAPGTSNVFAGNVGYTTVLTASAPAGTYFVRVRAVNADGISSASNEVTVVVGTGACALPAAPGSVSHSVSGTNVTIGWSAVSGATSYQLEAGSSPGAANLFNGDVGSVTSLGAEVQPGIYSSDCDRAVRAARALHQPRSPSIPGPVVEEPAAVEGLERRRCWGRSPIRQAMSPPEVPISSPRRSPSQAARSTSACGTFPAA